jgi:hypothetical protein
MCGTDLQNRRTSRFYSDSNSVSSLNRACTRRLSRSSIRRWAVNFLKFDKGLANGYVAIGIGGLVRCVCQPTRGLDLLSRVNNLAGFKDSPANHADRFLKINA